MATSDDKLQEALAKVVGTVGEAAAKLSERPEGAQILDRIAGVFGTSRDELTSDPERAKAAVREVGALLGRFAADAASGQADRQRAASERLAAFADRIGAGGDGADAPSVERAAQAVAGQVGALAGLLHDAASRPRPEPEGPKTLAGLVSSSLRTALDGLTEPPAPPPPGDDGPVKP